jgi:hypothetical protein
VGDPPRWPRDTPLSTIVGIKFRRQVAVAQSVYFACGLKATEFLLDIEFPHVDPLIDNVYTPHPGTVAAFKDHACHDFVESWYGQPFVHPASGTASPRYIQQRFNPKSDASGELTEVVMTWQHGWCAHFCSDMSEASRVIICLRFEVFTAVTIKNGVFWDITPCGSCKNRRFGRT